MAASRKGTESGARPSTAGDRYHLVYVARRLLDLLHPYSRLTQLVIENVSPADEAARRDASTFLGVDVAEYYGGEDAATSNAVDLVQVKYSPLRPGNAWTLSRLTERKRGGESVFRKLAAMFDALARSAHVPPSSSRVTVRLLTNQPLGSQLRQDLMILRGTIAGKSHLAAGRTLASVPGRVGETARAFKAKSGLTWSRLAELLSRWDLEGFEVPSLVQSEAELFQALSDSCPDAGQRLEVLLGNLQVRATPGQRETLRRADVLAFLHLTESDVQPAPTVFHDDAALFATHSSALVRQVIQQGDGWVVVHGPSGCGKTCAIRLALLGHGDGERGVVLYDCYSDGRGILPGAERFPYQKCFTQVINDLDARYRTGILSTVQLDYHTLMRQLTRALEAAATAAKRQGHRLVVAFDAIDNAEEQKRRAPSDAGSSFVPMLWRLRLPGNCTLVVSLRTENLAEVVGDEIPDARRVALQGFNEDESCHHAARLASSLSSEDANFLHQRTAGNPRVESKVLAEVAVRPRDARRIIEETARSTAFEYYDKEGSRRLASNRDRRFLAVLYEMKQAPKVADVSAITELDEREVRGLIGRLGFGLRLEQDRVAWQDQDFLDWTGERFRPEREDARKSLAEYCRRNFECDEYARWNLSYHFLVAGQFDELVVWWGQPRRLDEQIEAAHPHEERVLEDLRAAIVGALRIGQQRQAFDLLLRAAELAEGRDAFAEALAEHPGVAVAADLSHLIPGSLADRGGEGGTRMRYADAEVILTIAAELARQPERREIAGEVFARFKAAKEAECIQGSGHGGGLNVVEWETYARFQSRVMGLEGALRRLRGKKSDFWTRLFALTAGADWAVSGASDPLSALVTVAPGPPERACAALGILASDGDRPRGVELMGLEVAAVRSAVVIVARALTPKRPGSAVFLAERPGDKGPSGVPDRFISALGTAIENLTAAGLLKESRKLLTLWSPPEPRFRWREELEPYLRWAALREAVVGTSFDAANFAFPPRESRSGSSGQREREDVSRGEIRREIRRSYPPLRVRALAWAGTAAEEVAAEIRRTIDAWDAHLGERSGWSFQEMAAILLEAILALPTNQLLLVREVVEAAESALGASQGLARVAAADVLSRDQRYFAEAERLIRWVLDHCRPPEIPAREAMARLFRVCGAAARINGALARRVIVTAREAASEIDSRISSRAEAITTIAAAGVASLEPELLDKLCAVTRYWWSVDHESTHKAGTRALDLLAQKDPGAAVTRAWELDQRGLLDFEDGVGHVAAGALAGHSLPPGSIWPTLPLLTHPTLLDIVARSSIERLHEQGCAEEAPLAAYCRQVRLEGRVASSVERAREIVTWAHDTGLGAHPVLQSMQEYVESLDNALADQTPAARRQRTADESGERSGHRLVQSPLLATAREQLLQLPRAALEHMENASGADLLSIRFHELRDLMPLLLEALPLSDRSRLAMVIERWGAGHNGGDALLLLDSLLDHGGLEEPDLVQAVAEAARRLLTPDTLRSVLFYRSEGRTEVLAGRWASPEGRLQAVLGAMAEHLRELDSDTLFLLAAYAARLLAPEDLASVARDLIVRTGAEVPTLGAPASPGQGQDRVVPHALTLALGHPRQALRWRAVYAVVHALTESEAPESFLGPLLDAFDSTELPRWLSVREWLAFALEHVALRQPGILRVAVPRLIAHALSRELPHAKIRHHLKQVLLAIEQRFPGTLDEGHLAAIERTNSPVAIAEQQIETSLGLGREGGEREDAEDGDRIVPDFMDTVPYWYEPLSRCFAGEPRHVLRTIVRRGADWMACLGVTRSTVEAEELQVGERYDWAQTSNDHGSQPHVELLRLYGERHGLYLAAGELIDSTPVVKTFWSNGPSTEWEDWARYTLRGADPALPARLLDAPPPLADNYGVFARPVADWTKKDEVNAFSRELEVSGKPEWIVVLGERKGIETDRSFTSTVHSALVSPRTARALARLLEKRGGAAFLPVRELSYDCILPDLEKELGASEHGPEPFRGEHYGAGGLFVLRAWVLRFYQEASLHPLDPAWPENGRHYGLPCCDVTRRLGWTRHPLELLWRDGAGQMVARCDLWRRSDGGETRSAEGFRLLVRRDAVAAYSLAVGLDVIFAVRLRRQGRSDYRAGGKREFDRGTTHYFLWSDLGKPGVNWTG